MKSTNHNGTVVTISVNHLQEEYNEKYIQEETDLYLTSLTRALCIPLNLNINQHNVPRKCSYEEFQQTDISFMGC